jgi:NAD(P)-dependent dehydrogenase (short-subunit alcohol dehydrogenase family)
LAADGSFERKVVVVTGAAGGIGRALCFRFGRAGAHIAALDQDAAGTDALAQALAEDGIEAAAHVCDVTNPDQCKETMRAVEERFGGVDVLINNAGITQRSRFEETEISVYQKVMAVNFFGSLYCTKAALDSLRARRGMIIVTSSVAGFTPLLGRSGYAASKHALHGLFETLRCELASQGVRVMIVCPGFTATNIERSALDGSGRPNPRPQSRFGRQAAPEEVADAVYRGACSGKRMLVLSPVGRLARLLSRLSPAAYERAMSRRFRVELEP